MVNICIAGVVAIIAGTLAMTPSAQASTCGVLLESSLRPTVTDALGTLRAAVKLDDCDLCVCDANGDGELSAGDALSVLLVVTKSVTELHCQPCRHSVCGDGLRDPGEECDTFSVDCGLGSCGSDCRCQAKQQRPSFIVIITDDQPAVSLLHMPLLNELVAEKGTRFDNFHISLPWCCPSRATLLTGRYAHNHGIKNNKPPTGGAATFRSSGLDQSTLPTWLQSGGYRTGHVGKYLNGYEDTVGSYVPPGWDEWFVALRCEDRRYFDCQYSTNGSVVEFLGETHYRTDIEAEAAREFIETTPEDSPFFLVIAPFAPHVPSTPPPRHRGLFSQLEAPRSPAFNEFDLSDKHPWLRRQALLSETDIDSVDSVYRRMVVSLQAVDELVADVVAAVVNHGRADSTYIFYTTDNGYHFGDHRLKADKTFPYKPDVAFPLLVRGPNVAAGITDPSLVMNTDLAPTIAHLAGVVPAAQVDGRSIAPLWSGTGEDSRNRRSVGLLEFWWAQSTDMDPPQRYRGTVSDTTKYLEWPPVSCEEYDRDEDPFEINGTCRLQDDARSELTELLSSCSGDDCRALENVGE